MSMVRLTVIEESANGFTLKEINVESEDIRSVEEDKRFLTLLSEGKLEGLNAGHRFSSVFISNKGVRTVVGSPSRILELKQTRGRRLLRG